MTTGQINIWRYDVRRATRDALYQRRPFSELPSRYEFFNAIRQSVMRATFCAKLDDCEFSRYPRR
jgi:hypothetical protein